jgi:hypothetical protein
MLRGIFMSRLPIDTLQELIEWLTGYKPFQIELCSIIRPQIYDLINRDSLCESFSAGFSPFDTTSVRMFHESIRSG